MDSLDTNIRPAATIIGVLAFVSAVVAVVFVAVLREPTGEPAPASLAPSGPTNIAAAEAAATGMLAPGVAPVVPTASPGGASEAAGIGASEAAGIGATPVSTGVGAVPVSAGAGTTPGTEASAGTSLAEGTSGSAGAGTPLGMPGLPAGAAETATPVASGWRMFLEPTFGYSLEVPQAWPEVRPDTEPTGAGTGAAGAPAGRAGFEDPATGARLTVSVWTAAPKTTFGTWVAAVEPGMASVDGRGPTNGMVGGRAALVAWTPPTPGTAARYAVFLERDGRYYRIEYTAEDGGKWLGAFYRGLATFTWGDESGTDMIPRLPTPSATE